jgi:oligo-1,6-glucosidase
MLLSLRGTPFIYQGQEIGMTNFDFTSMEQLQDVESHNIDKVAKKLHIPKGYRWRMMQRCSRDNARTPMQWDDSPNAGFTMGKPWLGVNGNYKRINLAAQQDDPDSVRSYYKRMIALRADSDLLKYGTYKLETADKHLFCYRRELDGKICRVLLNFGKFFRRVSACGNVLISNYERTAFDGILQPYEAVILVPRDEIRTPRTYPLWRAVGCTKPGRAGG